MQRRSKSESIGNERKFPRSANSHQTPRKRGIQYAAASRLYRRCRWNAGSSAFADDDSWDASYAPACNPAAGQSSQRSRVVFAVGKAGFLEVEVAFDAPPDLVGDLAVAQQNVDEFSLRRDQFAGQICSDRADIMRVGIERIRQLTDPGLVARPQQLDHLVGQLAVVGDGVERLQRGIERLAARRDFRFVLR